MYLILKIIITTIRPRKRFQNSPANLQELKEKRLTWVIKRKEHICSSDCCLGDHQVFRLITACFSPPPTAIHQRRHALLHPDQDERQRERRRERANPHPRLPQDRSDAALHEPHRQHGTGCLRHVISWRPCWRRGIQAGWGRRREQDSHVLRRKKKEKRKTESSINYKHGCPVWPN